jgi:hypothetical protein
MFTTAHNHFTMRGAPSDVIEWNPFTICAVEVRIVDGARRKRDRRKELAKPEDRAGGFVHSTFSTWVFHFWVNKY